MWKKERTFQAQSGWRNIAERAKPLAVSHVLVFVRTSLCACSLTRSHPDSQSDSPQPFPPLAQYETLLPAGTCVNPIDILLHHAPSSAARRAREQPNHGTVPST